MQWNAAAYEVLGGASAEPSAGRSDLGDDRDVAAGDRQPAAVRDWFLRGGATRLAAISANTVTKIGDLRSPTVTRFARAGYVLLETDSQHCCRWVVPASGTDDDPPVYLVDPDDEVCLTRTWYAARFTDYTYAHPWDANLWRGDLITDFDHPLAPNALCPAPG